MTKRVLPKNVVVNPNSRRMFLKSAGGLTLALPFLPSLASLVLPEKLMAAQSNPIRYVSVRTHLGGLKHSSWVGPNLPTQSFELYPGQFARKDLISNLAGPSGLSPVFDNTFASLYPYMNFILGADLPSVYGHNSNAGSGAIANKIRNFAAEGVGTLFGEVPSVDQVMAFYNKNGVYGSSISGRTRYINIGSSESYGRDDYDLQSLPVVQRENVYGAANVFTTLFGSVSPADVTGTPSANPLLNLVNEFWASGRSLISRLSVEDRRSIDQLFQLAQQASQDYALPGPSTAGYVRPPDNAYSMSDYADVIAMAFKCDLTRVVNIDLHESINGYNWHDGSHTEYKDPNFATRQTEMTAMFKNIASQFFLRLGTNLNVADPLYPSETMLTNSLIKWTHENKTAHETFSLPLMMMGAAGGRINTGIVADLRNTAVPAFGTDYSGDGIYQGDLLNRLWPTLFYGMDVPKSAYEYQRGGGAVSLSLDKGYGHLIQEKAGWFYGLKQTVNTYNLSKIGEPWEFLRKSSVTWS